jgi:hypothetical protein
MRRSLNMMTLQKATNDIWAIAKPGEQLDLSDMGRASVVLAVAAMDSYFTSIFLERLVPFIKRKGPTKDLVAYLHEAGLDTAFALKLIVSKSPFRRIRRLVETRLETFTTQKFDVINKLFEIYGMKDFCKNVAGYSGKNDRLLVSIRKLVLRRHKIVHEGDLNSHGTPATADRKEFERRIHDIILFVSKADELLHKQLHS